MHQEYKTYLKKERALNIPVSNGLSEIYIGMKMSYVEELLTAPIRRNMRRNPPTVIATTPVSDAIILMSAENIDQLSSYSAPACC